MSINYFIKGAEDVFDVLGIKPEAAEGLKDTLVSDVPEPLKELKETIGQSYRATPYTVLFGRYRNTLGGAARSVKDRIKDLFD